MTTIRDVGWWYWFLTVGLLGAGLMGWAEGIYLAMVVCTVQIIHVIRLKREARSFPLQVRVAYLGLLLAGLWGPLQWVHWMQLVGTSARVTLGFCFLVRTPSLAPWNRRSPFTLALVRRTYLAREPGVPSSLHVFPFMALERVHEGIGKPCIGTPTKAYSMEENEPVNKQRGIRSITR